MKKAIVEAEARLQAVLEGKISPQHSPRRLARWRRAYQEDVGSELFAVRSRR